MEKRKDFLENPSEETFSLIENNSSALNDVYNKAPHLADKFFQFNHWFLLYRERNNSKDILQKMRDSEQTFEDAFKLHYQLTYDERQEHIPRLIELASTVRNCSSALHLLGNRYRKEIIEKMNQVAITDEDKAFASFYKI